MTRYYAWLSIIGGLVLAGLVAYLRVVYEEPQAVWLFCGMLKWCD